jgi:hypothetical protein
MSAPRFDAATNRKKTTQDGHNGAIEHYDAVIVICNKADGGSLPCFDDITKSDVEADNAMLFLTAYANACCNLSQPKANGHEKTPKSLAKYFDHIWQELKTKFDQKDGLLDIDQERIRSMRNNIEEFSASRLKEAPEQNEPDNLTKVPLFAYNQGEATANRTYLSPEDHPSRPSEPICDTGVDLYSICDRINREGMPGDQSHTRKLQMVITRLCIGRGGEFKFVRVSKMWFETFTMPFYSAGSSRR